MALLWHIKGAGNNQGGANHMKKTAIRLIAILLLFCSIPVSALGTEYLVPGGQVIGLKLEDDSVIVAAFDHTMEAGRKGGLRIGDEILSIDSKPIDCAADVRSALDRSGGQIKMVIQRQKQQHTLTICPDITAEGPKLGIYLKEGVTGIGTVTWYDPETGDFGTLGHGVHKPSGQLLEMVSGKIYDARVLSVKAGQAGAPGQLKGGIDTAAPLGTLRRNTAKGVFGKADRAFRGDALPVATSDAVKTGNATILSTVEGSSVREYSVEILKIYPTKDGSARNMLLRVTDPQLLSITGGIVQGMSGSPIIQDGKLVGAVTHVLVNDPTTGYGIFIENMLDAAA
jgi:stage IV sporulation protein B